MRRRLTTLVPLLMAVLALFGASGARAASVVTVPAGKPLYLEGQDGRRVIDGPWLLRMDPADVGVAQRFYAQAATDGWTVTSVPSAWNAGDDSAASFAGSVAWYRKDFRLPSRSRTLSWIARFESVNYRATVWLNGRRIGQHVGGYLPFELDLGPVVRRGVNRLVVRVDNRRPFSDPSGAPGDRPIPPGGWWNYGGILREVYLRPVDRVDVATVQVLPSLPCARCAATVTVRATLRNVTRRTVHVHLSGRFGRAPLDLGTQTIPAGASATFARALVVPHPRVWSPAHPNLYDVRLVPSVAQDGHAATPAAGYTLRTGIRSLRVSRGQLLLNGLVVHFRGVALHEDTLAQGAAVDNATRAKVLALVRESGSTLVRSHYPLHPEFQELADRLGILLWSEVPAPYQLPDADLGRPAFRDLALQQLQADVAENANHPSVAIWSVGNEMPSDAGPNQAAYLRAAAALVHQLDPTRPVGLAFAGHPETPCQTAYAPIDVLGMNDYFGWYTGFGGNIADRDLLPSYLDALRACYPKKAIAVTEYGAEANRDGPVDEKGTYAFQADFIRYHLGVFASKPWLTGAVYWALQEFRVRPGWGGGNPWGTPPYHTKGVVRLDWTQKPGYAALRDGQRAVRQLVPPARLGRAGT